MRARNGRIEGLVIAGSSRAETRIPERLVFGRSRITQEVLRTVEQSAPLNAPVLIQGQRGKGKEIIAHEIHRRSPRYGEPFVKIEF